MSQPGKGSLLIANPFLKDPNFVRSVILLCEHVSEGTLGFVLNKKYPLHLDEILPGCETTGIPVFTGGPVQPDTLHFLHQSPDLIPGGARVGNGIFWGGNFETLLIRLNNNELDLDKLKFFIGYSGWTEGQLDMEMKEESWIAADATRSLVFSHSPEETWKNSLRHLGGRYEQLINYPLDPQLN